MKPLLHRVLNAYRPLHSRGLLLDGPGRWPPAASPDASMRRPRPRLLLAALASLRAARFTKGSP